MRECVSILNRRSLIGASGLALASAAVAEVWSPSALLVRKAFADASIGPLPRVAGSSGTIVAAAIEFNGWVLRITMIGSISAESVSPDTGATAVNNFASYVLVPNSSSPAVTISMNSNGFISSGGMAVASSTVQRTLVGTQVLRRAVIAGSAASSRSAKTPDEVDNGDGTITVRIGLSQHVYAGDSGLTLTTATGWCAGAVANFNYPVTNYSTVAAPAPIVRWSDVPYQLQNGGFNLECVVVSHHPNGLLPVAGVKFTVTDGMTQKEFWTTTLSTSALYSAGGTGTPLRVYSVTVDPTTATALMPGLLRCDFEVYPWIGPAQKSDVAGTKSMAGLGTVAMSTNAFVPFVVAYNPGGAWITPRYVDVDETNGTSVAARVTVALSPTDAAAGTPANNINTAILAIFNANITVAAANGQPAIMRSVDGCHIRLRQASAGTGCTGIVNGTSAAAGNPAPSGVSTNATWLTIEGDLADTTGRASILRSPAIASATSRVTRVRVAGLSLEAQNNACLSAIYAWLDNVEVRGVIGQYATNGIPVGAIGAVQFVTGSKWWQHGSSLKPWGTSQNIILLRNVSVERTLGAPLVVNCARLPTAIAGTTGVQGGEATLSGLGNIETIVSGCDLRYLNSSPAWVMATMSAKAAPANLTLGTTNPVRSRAAFVNNVCETYGGSGAPLWNQIGENNQINSTEVIIEGNTFTGDRVNCPYDDLNLPTVALNDTADNLILAYRVANNIMMKASSKHDRFNDPAVAAQRAGVPVSATRNRTYAVGAEIVIAGSPANIYHCTTAGRTAASGGPTGTGVGIVDGSAVWQWIAFESRLHGYRPQALGGWSQLYGVGYEGNIDFQPVKNSSPEFFFEYFGMGSDQLAAEDISIATSPFTADKSGGPNRMAFQPLPDGTGGGNYRPLTSGAGTYAIGRGRSANIDVDASGVARQVPFAAGALQPASS